jgi:hypothetical protein
VCYRLLGELWGASGHSRLAALGYEGIGTGEQIIKTATYRHRVRLRFNSPAEGMGKKRLVAVDDALITIEQLSQPAGPRAGSAV